MRRHDVISYIKNQFGIENRIDFLRKSAHEKYMNVDFMGNVCKNVMINMMSVTHTHDLELVWLLKGCTGVIRLFSGAYVVMYSRCLCNK